ncbi:hypothetical protein PMZ80_008656 [Knufia obscura]|uniref:Uncharacterized protein n=2 Tax=Knufia TaxID=430999 RepID=A0AAN8I2X1_9EURO|nr:hypothetical protein PMZ80_008656 [Knufia obscura]KAK5952112.1 hypothetical protein OHC33_006999 [Knufia fluminis]
MPTVNDLPLEILNLIFQHMYHSYNERDSSNTLVQRNADFSNVYHVSRSWRSDQQSSVFDAQRFDKSMGFVYDWWDPCAVSERGLTRRRRIR